jgi:hypothetical protein
MSGWLVAISYRFFISVRQFNVYAAARGKNCIISINLMQIHCAVPTINQ